MRFRGGGTKLGWGRAVPEPDLEICTGGLDRVLEHNAGDFTAVLQAGVPLAVAQEAFAEAGQMLALDPPLSPWGGAGDDAAIEAADAGATIGGIVATNDSGPLRHKYGGVRDLVVGVTVVLSDGTIARAGGKVIKNVAGYDIGKLFAGAFGTLGLIAEVTVRLHPRPARTATVVARSSDPTQLAAAAAALAHAPLEADCLDLWWDASLERRRRFWRPASAVPTPGARRVGGERPPLLRKTRRPGSSRSTPTTTPAGRRSGPPSGATWWSRSRPLPAAFRRPWPPPRTSAAPWSPGPASGSPGSSCRTSRSTAASSATVRARQPGPDPTRGRRPMPAGVVAAVEELRRRLAPAPCVVLDAPTEVRAALDPWGGETGPVELMRKVKERFDPAGVCAPGLFVGGI